MAEKIAVIGFRVTSAYFFLNAIVPLLAAFQNPGMLAAIVTIGGGAVLLVLGIGLWKYACFLPEKLLWSDGQGPGEQPIEALLLRIVGLYVFFTAIPTLVWQVAMAIGSSPDPRSSRAVGMSVAGGAAVAASSCRQRGVLPRLGHAAN